MNTTLTLIDLAGAVALLIWGVHMVQTGVSRAFGSHLRRALTVALGNRFKAFAAGLTLLCVKIVRSNASPSSHRCIRPSRSPVPRSPAYVTSMLRMAHAFTRNQYYAAIFIRLPANGPNIRFGAARGFPPGDFPTDLAPTAARFPSDTEFHAGDCVTSRNARGDLPIPDHTEVHRHNRVEEPGHGRGCK
jgi:hypothetical protein